MNNPLNFDQETLLRCRFLRLITRIDSVTAKVTDLPEGLLSSVDDIKQLIEECLDLLGATAPINRTLLVSQPGKLKRITSGSPLERSRSTPTPRPTDGSA